MSSVVASRRGLTQRTFFRTAITKQAGAPSSTPSLLFLRTPFDSDTQPTTLRGLLRSHPSFCHDLARLLPTAD